MSPLIEIEIQGYPNYTVSHGGDIYSKVSKIKLKQFLNKRTGYLQVGLRGKLYDVHRVVAKAFIANPENKRTVNHKDGNRINNSVGNLEWNTSSENNYHAYREGKKKPPDLGKFGKANSKSKAIIAKSIFDNSEIIFYSFGEAI